VAMAEYPELGSWNKRNTSLVLEAGIQDQGFSEILAFVLRPFLLPVAGTFSMSAVMCSSLYPCRKKEFWSLPLEDTDLITGPSLSWFHLKFPLTNTNI
jgi:hypothetical protein